MIRIGGKKIPRGILVMLASDACLPRLALLIAIGLRFHITGAVVEYLGSPYALTRFLVVVVTCLLALYYNDLYDSEVIGQRSEFYFRLFQALGIPCLALGTLYYFFPD